MRLKEDKSLLVGKLIIAVSFLTIVLTYFTMREKKDSVYRFLHLLPYGHAVIMLVFVPFTKNMLKYPAQWCIYLLYFIRNCMTPIFMYLANYDSVIKINSGAAVNKAIVLMLYETFTVYLVMALWEKRKQISSHIKIRISPPLFNKLLVLLGAIIVVCLLLAPMLRSSYESIFHLSRLISVAGVVNKETLGGARAFYTIGQVCISVFRLLITIVALWAVRKRTENPYMAIIAAGVVAFVQCMFLGAQLLYFFYIMGYIFFLTIRLFPRTKKILISGTAVLFPLMLVFLMMTKLQLNSANVWGSMGKSLNAYLPGVANIAGVIENVSERSLRTVFADFYTMIPFRNSIFGLQVQNLSDIFNEANQCQGQILPLLGESYYYFGAILSPILSVLFAVGAMKANEKMNYAKNCITYAVNVMMMLYLSTMILCKNLILFGSLFFSTLLPLWVFSLVTEKSYSFKNIEK